MRWLQALVAVMSIMIVAGVTIIGVTIAHRLSTHPTTLATRESGRSEVQSVAAQSILKLPAGTHVLGISNGGDRIVLRAAGADQLESLYIIDIETGRLIRQITLDNR